MKKALILFACIFSLIFSVSCENEEKDTELPVIMMNGTEHFPQNCDTVFIGESFTFSARFTDNYELGSYTIDIHHNFDHHSHSTDVADCPAEPVKSATNPFLLIEQLDMPDGINEYDASLTIEIPEGADPGDYHMMVRLTDKTGWQAIRGISIKVVQ